LAQDAAGLECRVGPARFARQGDADAEPPPLLEEKQAGADMQDAEHEERGTPADQLAKKAPRRLAEDDTEDLTGDVACQQRLPALVGYHVADPGDGQRDHRRGPGPGQKAKEDDGRQRRHGRTDDGGDSGPQRAQHHHQQFTACVPERANHDLAHAIGDRKGGNHRRSRADGHAELGGDLWQERVADAQVGGTDEGCQRQKQNGARGRRAGIARCRRIHAPSGGGGI
jgi:hypothetical protein